MKTLIDHINEALKIGKNLSKFSTYSCQPTSKRELVAIIKSRIAEDGPNCDLNDIDTSLITDISWLFNESEFNGNISKWNVSKVENMNGTFYKSKFNQDISNWKIRKDCIVIEMFDRSIIKDEFKPKLPS